MGLTRYRIRKMGRKRKRKVGELSAIVALIFWWVPD